MKIPHLLALFSLLAILPAGADSQFSESMTLRSVEKNSGQPRWTSRIEGQQFSYQGQTFIYYVEKGKEDQADGKSWVSTAYSVVKQGQTIPYSVSVVIRNRQGEIVEKVNKYYDLPGGKILCVVNGKSREFKFAANMVDKQEIGIALMKFPFGQKQEENYHLLTHEPTMYQISVWARGREKVRGIDCYKLEIVFNLGALNIFNAFIPKFYAWYEVREPHLFVKYEGLESGLGTPYVVVERQ